LCAGRTQDRASCYQREPLPAKALRLADLGYFTLPVMADLAQKDVYWLSRYRAKTALYTPDGKELKIDPVFGKSNGKTL